MKRFLIAAAITAATIAYPAVAGEVGVSVNIGQPGFYGQIDIGDYPTPQVIYRRPVVVERVYREERQPIYLRVPPSHAKHWSKHCHEYNACGERVLFVQDGWYNREYAPRYQERYRERGYERRDEHGDNPRRSGIDRSNERDYGRNR